MASQENLSVSVGLSYAQAGIAFRLNGACRADTPPTVEIVAVACGSDQPLTLLDSTVPVLEDFIPGFTRWLRTCRIDADVTMHAVRGHLPDRTTVGHLLQAIGRACDMIDQRFALYTESILV